MEPVASRRTFPTWAGILFGLGLGGFFDGIVLHQERWLGLSEQLRAFC
jgi:uncharacterized membrane protein